MGSVQLNDPSSKTIQFNVGGKLYEVSKSLLQAYPTSLLAEKAATEETSPIFIDRDPDRFSLCLDFLRDNGEVFLPESVTKAALLKELDLYSLKPVDGARIHNDESSMRNTAMRISKVMLKVKQNIKAMETEINSLKRKVGMEKVASHCFTEFLKNPVNGRKISIGQKGDTLRRSIRMCGYNYAGKEDFNACLNKFGLVSKRSNVNDPYGIILDRL